MDELDAQAILCLVLDRGRAARRARRPRGAAIHRGDTVEVALADGQVQIGSYQHVETVESGLAGCAPLRRIVLVVDGREWSAPLRSVVRLARLAAIRQRPAPSAQPRRRCDWAGPSAAAAG